MNPLEILKDYIVQYLSMEETQAYMLLTGVFTALGVLVIILVIGQLMGVDSVRKFFHRNPIMSLLMKIGALAGTWFLAQSDYFSVYSIFFNSESLFDNAPEFLSYTFASFLEGFAFLLGIFLSGLTDPTNFRKSSRRFNWIGTVTSAVALITAWALSIYQRTSMLEAELLEEMLLPASYKFWDIMAASDPDQVFMMVSPVLTSVLAFGLSWFAFPHNSLEEQEQQVEYRLDRYLRFSKRYKQQLMHFQQLKIRLWTALVGGEEGDIANMPEDSNIYQMRCQQLIRRKTVNACVNAFSGEFGSYNKAIEAKLEEYIAELSKCSTLPHLITNITVKEVLYYYEEEMREKNLDSDLWDSKELRQAKQERLRRELDNAACRAEFWFSPKKKK